ncbi:hypothetical protein L1049_022983 [Liquidambar formosana]|uniref:Uncharacterized protein n=1 Tax=Liquidambar formosana TaxID=63359 RepID=A0AAP0RDD3_LIQFO
MTFLLLAKESSCSLLENCASFYMDFTQAINRFAASKINLRFLARNSSDMLNKGKQRMTCVMVNNQDSSCVLILMEREVIKLDKTEAKKSLEKIVLLENPYDVSL